MKHFALPALFVLIAANPLPGQSSRPPLSPGPSTTTDLGQANRQKNALGAESSIVARFFIRYTKSGDVTTTFFKLRPKGFRLNVESDRLKWGKVARSLKPIRTEGRPGYWLVAADWNASNHKRKAKCHSELTPGFHEVIFLRGTDTTDFERDNFICRFSFLPLPEEDLQAWIAAVPADDLEAFNACAEASDRTVDPQFWVCASEAGLPLPELTAEMTKRIKKAS